MLLLVVLISFSCDGGWGSHSLAMLFMYVYSRGEFIVLTLGHSAHIPFYLWCLWDYIIQ